MREAYFYLEEVLRRAVDFLEGLLAGIWHSLHRCDSGGGGGGGGGVRKTDRCQVQERLFLGACLPFVAGDQDLEDTWCRSNG